MTELQWCTTTVLSLVGWDMELAARWWLSPNKAFGMRTPNSMPVADVKDYLLKFI